jgi:hypothetical protein
MPRRSRSPAAAPSSPATSPEEAPASDDDPARLWCGIGWGLVLAIPLWLQIAWAIWWVWPYLIADVATRAE